nr:MAG TPA: hypothetical protein [Caudoviricetes sp.]
MTKNNYFFIHVAQKRYCGRKNLPCGAGEPKKRLVTMAFSGVFRYALPL